ncbi:wsc domain-containing protein [Mucor ambiguus]|uniref:Wsc domain-containing protein n=1 Tax=Mucor ambiguus TaxID=91626 RepID=A0A0C9M034_9FUNG|nr:wsc domain-containing protein [Mucor ambiguus]
MPLDDGDDRMQMLASEDDQLTSNLLPSSRTQHSLTKSEIVQGMANRFMYSKFYIGLYLVLAILSFVTIVMSIKETCPSVLFIVFEAIINFAMIIEVTTRLLALGRRYWKSVWNIVDIILVVLCAVTLIVLTTGCSVGERSEAIFDTILLVIRNGFQLFRLFMMLRKNQYSLHARSTRIDFDDIPDVEREPSLEFTALDRDRGLDESFLDDEDSDMEQGRL